MKSLFIKSTLVCLFTGGFYLPGQAQQAITARQAVFLELGGNGVFLSVNYDRIVYQRSAFKVSLRAGFGLLRDAVYSYSNTLAGQNYAKPLLPLEVNGMFGKRKGHLELGLGYTPYLDKRNDTYQDGQGSYVDNIRWRLNSLVFARLGYRYQKPEGGFFFRVAITPIVVDAGPGYTTQFFQPFAGLGVGMSF